MILASIPSKNQSDQLINGSNFSTAVELDKLAAKGSWEVSEPEPEGGDDEEVEETNLNESYNLGRWKKLAGL